MSGLHVIERIITYIKTGLLVIGFTVVFYLLTAFTLSIISTNPHHSECQKDYKIFIASNGVHLDLIVPRKHLPSKLDDELDLPNWVSYIAFGWGDKEFYINTPSWSDLNFRTTFKALFLDSESAVHITWVSQKYPRWTAVPMCNIQIQRLIDYLDQTFKRTPGPEGDLLEIEAAGYSTHDNFYQANGNFSFVQTCNNWVNEGLKAAEVKTCIWSPFDKGVLYQMRRSHPKNKTGNKKR